MTYKVSTETFAPRILAAVRRRVPVKEIPTAFKPALDLVWDCLRRNRGLRTDGHNIFLYHHENPEIVTVDFGVEVVRPFAAEGDVSCVTTPEGEAAVVVHRGPYAKMHDAHNALHQWCEANGRNIGDHSMEIYGDWSNDPEKLETTIVYFLR
jgi:effector-binding domain-containing protein